MKIFMTGVAGYIGGAVATRLLQEGHLVRGLVETQEQAERIQKMGLTAVIGTLEDATLLAHEVLQADTIINASSTDHRASVEIMLNALAGSGKAFIHTSGSNVISSNLFSNLKKDAKCTDVLALTSGSERASIEQMIRDAAYRDIRSVILCNTTVYCASPDKVQTSEAAAQSQKSAGNRYIGKGINIWSNFHIRDVVELYMIALRKAPAGSFYFI